MRVRNPVRSHRVNERVLANRSGARHGRLNTNILQRVLTETRGGRFEFDALDLAPDELGVLARLAGPAAALKALTGEVPV